MKWIARWLVMCVVVSGSPAWAQGQGDGRQTKTECDHKTYTAAEWAEMSVEAKHFVCEAGPEQVPPQNQKVDEGNKPLAWAGVATTLAGIAALGPWGDQYTILGHTYCVTDHAVYGSSCNAKGTQAMIGLGLLAGGITMLWVGLRHVSVAPELTHTRKQVTAKVTW